LSALPGIARVTAVSEAVRGSIEAIAGERVSTSLLPNVVDEQVFHAPGADDRWDPDQILFVGAVRHVKGLDVLLRAMAWLAPVRPRLRLLVLGEAIYGQWRRDELAVRKLCRELALEDRVRFAGRATPEAVAAAMRASAALVVPGRRESFSAVAIEALASGTPVVATRCGGPEEFLTGETGLLVNPEDPEGLGRGIDAVLSARARYAPEHLRDVAVGRFGVNAIAARLRALYTEVLAARSAPSARSGSGSASG
jgi:glycosyltransferase involved in cell wall biosynthesis